MTLNLPFLSSLYQEKSLFFWFSIWRWQPFWDAILNLKVKTDQNMMNTINQISKAKISGK